MNPLLWRGRAVAALGALLPALAQAQPPAQLLQALQASARMVQADFAPSAARGAAFFSVQHGELACTSCHGTDPRMSGRHAVTGKVIEPLAPSANPARLADAARTEKWFRRNCKDVLARECTVAEKADVVAWLVSLR
jgi:hypothetical protein